MKDVNQQLVEAIHGLIYDGSEHFEFMQLKNCETCKGVGVKRHGFSHVEKCPTYYENGCRCRWWEVTGEPELRHVLWALQRKHKKDVRVHPLLEEVIEIEFFNGTDKSSQFYTLAVSLFQQKQETKEWLLNLLTKQS